jgi:quercetin dioxygenase-like cupin family protein
MERYAAALLAVLLVVVGTTRADEMGILHRLSDNKFAPLPKVPPCLAAAVQNGDPAKGPSVILFQAPAGCAIPHHWHTPNEQVMLIAGEAKVEMRDGAGSGTIGPGGFAMMPSKHVHQFTCTTVCMGFLHSDAAFDIHYVDDKGKEITPDAAYGGKKVSSR